MGHLNRRKFLGSIAATGLGMSMLGKPSFASHSEKSKDKKIGVIGLDTSHGPNFTRVINDPDGGPEVSGFTVTAAYPYGSRNIESSYSRIPQYTGEFKEMGIEIVDSIDQLLDQVDFVLLLTNDGHPRLEQALQVMEAGKSMYVDKPVAASLRDVIAILDASEEYNVPIFSSSGLRYIETTQSVRYHNAVGQVLGVDAYSPAAREETHPDLFWYGIHGVETVFTVLGTGCREVSRVTTKNADVVIGKWDNEIIGTFRGILNGRRGYGGTAFGTDDNLALGPYTGSRMMVHHIIDFFRTGIIPVPLEETLEIYAFMEAADESKRRGGASIPLRQVIARAKS